VIVIEEQPTRVDAPAATGKPTRRFGTLAGTLQIADYFDAPLLADVKVAYDGESRWYRPH
jgi:hypothetical protein